MMDIIDILPFSNPVVARAEMVLCDVCTENVDQNSDRIVIPPAEMFCMQCRQTLCRECAFHHERNKMTKLHHLVPHETELNGQVDALDSAVLRLYEKHLLESLFYYEHCKEAVCPICFLEKHELHKFMDAKQLINSFKQESDNHINQLSELVCESKKNCEIVAENTKQFQETAERLMDALVTNAEDGKLRTNRCIISVKQKIRALKPKALNDLEERMESYTNEFQAYMDCKNLKSLVTMCNITETLQRISDTAHQIKNNHQLRNPVIVDCGSSLNCLSCLTG